MQSGKLLKRKENVGARLQTDKRNIRRIKQPVPTFCLKFSLPIRFLLKYCLPCLEEESCTNMYYPLFDYTRKNEPYRRIEIYKESPAGSYCLLFGGNAA